EMPQKAGEMPQKAGEMPQKAGEMPQNLTSSGICFIINFMDEKFIQEFKQEAAELQIALQKMWDYDRVDQIEDYYQVAKSNALVFASYKLTPLEQKLILIFASKIHPDDRDFKAYKINTNVLGGVLKIDHNDLFNDLRQATFNILKKPFQYYDYEEKGLRQTNWFASCFYKDDDADVYFQFHPSVQKLLLNLKNKGNFTTFTLTFALRMKSSYAIRLYEILKSSYEKQISLKKKPDVIFYIDDIKKVLAIEKEYNKYSHFKKRILESAKKEINEKSDIFFTYNEIKKARKVERLKFNIKLNIAVKEKIDKDLFELNQISIELMSLGISEDKAKEIERDFDEEVIKEKVNQFKWLKKNYPDKIKGDGSYLYQSIIKNWIDDDFINYKNEIEKENIEKKKREEKKIEIELKKKYEEYKKNMCKSYDELEPEIQKIIDKAVDKVMEPIKNKNLWTEITINLLIEERRKIEIENNMLESGDLISFDEWKKLNRRNCGL
ncbi:MAG: replication initiation protein, partial [Magnetococcus sp. YQC-3]